MADEADVPTQFWHPCRVSDQQLLEQCRVRRTRHSGPGGQHRNKVETAVEMIHAPSGIVSFAAERRSQEENRRTALGRLRLLLAVGIRSPVCSIVEPTTLWQSRCSAGKIVCSERHQDFPSMLCEALDAIHCKNYDVRRAAAALGATPSQLIRFIARVPEALLEVNRQREIQGLHRLHGD